MVSTSEATTIEGVTLVQNIGEALQAIVSEVTDVSDLMDEIAAAAARQATRISEISAMVEESTAFSQNLFNETRRLLPQLSFFDLGENEARNRLRLAS